MDFSSMDAIVASSTYMMQQTVLAFFNFLLLVWPIVLGVVLGVGALFAIWRFLRSKIGGGGKLVGR